MQTALAPSIPIPSSAKWAHSSPSLPTGAVDGERKEEQSKSQETWAPIPTHQPCTHRASQLCPPGLTAHHPAAHLSRPTPSSLRLLPALSVHQPSQRPAHREFIPNRWHANAAQIAIIFMLLRPTVTLLFKLKTILPQVSTNVLLASASSPSNRKDNNTPKLPFYPTLARPQVGGNISLFFTYKYNFPSGRVGL